MLLKSDGAYGFLYVRTTMKEACTHISQTNILFLYYNDTNQVISPSYGSKACCIGPRPSRPVTGPIRNYLISDNFIN